MARATLTPTPFAPNAGIADPAGTASVAGAGNGFTIPAQGSKLVLLRVTNGTGGSGTASILAGSQPSAIASGQGPLVDTVGAGATRWIGPFESARFQQPDGTLAIETSVVMTVTAFTVDGRYVG
ncbi:hypothetical protein RR49_01165 [Microbacterium ginsengisoli]|uniref:Uncharacterized protein n=1 Tax=Microbacterium ginsengisoli TaxID=400772 RepID=A0A0F0LV90_9MICO|nr:hypothetical protein [Microbacterium ginsengisoli]KJL37053.1 hypothetical protein RR49_01165 [Microbacterium ginsengisoli]